ncbi:MAG TPA: hypothetical protein DF296_10875 [Candidatus Margulisbacteria bacterium]|nr:hypothetical protein [Candidatus Margulisiibacteriota bacterium]
MEESIVLNKCPVCDDPTDNSERLLDNFIELNNKQLHYSVDVCDNCGAMYTVQRTRYNELYTPKANIEKKHGHQNQTQAFALENIWNYANKMLQVEELLSALSGNDCNYLEIGASDGSLFYLFQLKAKQKGIEVTGTLIESTGAAQICEELGNCKVISKSFMDQNIVFDRKYDVAILSNCLEHFDNPRQIIAKVRSLLKEGGLLYIEVPDATRYDTSISYPLGYYHVVNYNIINLDYMIHNAGFEVFDMDIRDQYPGMRIAAIKKDINKKTIDNLSYRLTKSIFNRWKIRRERIFTSLEKIKEKIAGKILIYGAGVHTKALIDRFSGWLSDDNVVFYDSNEEIKLFMGRSLLSHDQLNLDDYEAIIISSYGYQEQIFRHLVQLGYPEKKIIRLYDRVLAYTM